MILLLSVVVSALASPPQEATEAWKTLSQTTSVSASFHQVQNRTLLSRPLESDGRLVFSQPDKLRWEVSTPSASVFVMNGTTLTSHVPSLEVTEEVDLASSPELRGLVEGLTIWLSGDLERVQRDYTLSWTPPNQAKLVPNDPKLARILTQLELELAEDHTYVRAVTITEPDGDTIQFTLSNVSLNQEPDAHVFQVP